MTASATELFGDVVDFPSRGGAASQKWTINSPHQIQKLMESVTSVKEFAWASYDTSGVLN